MDLMGLCSICGKPGAMFSCSLCGKLVCGGCFDSQNHVCSSCGVGKQ